MDGAYCFLSARRYVRCTSNAALRARMKRAMNLFLLPGECVANLLCKARRIAESLKLALFFRPDRSWPEDLRRQPRISSPCT
jgi:hypothetical protein